MCCERVAAGDAAWPPAHSLSHACRAPRLRERRLLVLGFCLCQRAWVAWVALVAAVGVTHEAVLLLSAGELLALALPSSLFCRRAQAGCWGQHLAESGAGALYGCKRDVWCG